MKSISVVRAAVPFFLIEIDNKSLLHALILKINRVQFTATFLKLNEISALICTTLFKSGPQHKPQVLLFEWMLDSDHQLFLKMMFKSPLFSCGLN